MLFLYIPSSNKRQLLSPNGFFPNTDVYVRQFTRYKVENSVSDGHMMQREASGDLNSRVLSTPLFGQPSRGSSTKSPLTAENPIYTACIFSLTSGR